MVTLGTATSRLVNPTTSNHSQPLPLSPLSMLAASGSIPRLWPQPPFAHPLRLAASGGIPRSSAAGEEYEADFASPPPGSARSETGESQTPPCSEPLPTLQPRLSGATDCENDIAYSSMGSAAGLATAALLRGAAERSLGGVRGGGAGQRTSSSEEDQQLDSDEGLEAPGAHGGDGGDAQDPLCVRGGTGVGQGQEVPT